MYQQVFIFTMLIVIRIRYFVNAFFIFFKKISMHDICMESHVNALTGLYLISTVEEIPNYSIELGVNALTG